MKDSETIVGWWQLKGGNFLANLGFIVQVVLKRAPSNLVVFLCNSLKVTLPETKIAPENGGFQ